MYTANGECCELSIPNIFAKAVYQRDRRADRNFGRGESLSQYSCPIICIKTRSRRKIMFVPLPVPFVFQRTAPDLNAWRLKSPLALRSNSGKTFLFVCVLSPLCFTSSMSFRLGRADPPRCARCRCTGGRHSSAPCTHFTRRAQTPPSPFVGSTESSTHAQRLLRSHFGFVLCVGKSDQDWKLIASNLRVCVHVRRTAISSVIVRLHCAHVSAHFSLPSPSPSFPSPPLPAPVPQPPSLPN